MRDSAGLAVTTIGIAPDETEVWSLAGPPELVLSGREAADAPPFGDLRAAAWGPGGEILVLDEQASGVHVFGAAGAYLRTLGREGEGPGELRSPVTVSATEGDAVYVYDRTQDRLSIFHMEAGFVRSVPFGREDGAPAPLSVWNLCPGRLVGYATRPHRDSRTGPYPRRLSREALLTLYDGDGSVVAGPVRFPGGYSAVVEGGDLGLPFANGPVRAVGGRRVVYGSGESFRLTVLDRGFRPVRRIVWPGRREPIRDEELEAVRRHVRRTYAPLPDAEVEMLENTMVAPELLPERAPAVGRVRLDPEGRIWVARFRPPVPGPNDRWFVLDETGRPRGRLQLPPRSELEAVNGDRVMLIRKDELNVPRVEVYRVRRE